MPRLIVTRRRGGIINDLFPLQLVIDKDLATSIKLHQRLAIDLPPGRHDVMALLGTAVSDPFEITAGLEGDHHVEVGVHGGNWDLVLTCIFLVFIFRGLDQPVGMRQTILLLGGGRNFGRHPSDQVEEGGAAP